MQGRCALVDAFADALGDAAMGAKVRVAGDGEEEPDEDAEGDGTGDTAKDCV